tara:strand:- start:298 stop:510 length:213 start_codon:yes stop_codon:yes gene_type:complete
MTTFDLTKKTVSYKNKISSTGQKITFLGGGDINTTIKISKLENRINNQEEKLDKILELLQNGNNLLNTNK